MKRRLQCLLLSLIMGVAVIIPANASEVTSSPQEITEYLEVTENFTEYIDSNGSIVRTLKRTPVMTYSLDEDYSVIKADLLRLGMEERDIASLDKAALAKYNGSDEITTVVSYNKVDKDGNVFYISEEEALVASAQISSNLPSEDHKTVEDSYMRVYHEVSHTGGANYSFKTSARWLTMPYFRGQDAVGSVQSYCTIIPYSGHGTYGYHVDTYDTLGKKTGSTDKKGLIIETSDDVSKGIFYGEAGLFNIPFDKEHSDGSIRERITDFHVVYSYDGRIQNESDIQSFNSTGSYVHTKVKVSLFSSLTINSSGASPELGLSWSIAHEVRSAKLLIGYSPS